MAIKHLKNNGIGYLDYKIDEIIYLIAKNHGFSILNLSVEQKTDEEVRRINREFLNHDYYTDIITFNNGEAQNTIDCDIVISHERVRDNAKKNNVSDVVELVRVIFHGVLHLVGYDDGSNEEKVKMREMEDIYLKYWFHVEPFKD